MRLANQRVLIVAAFADAWNAVDAGSDSAVSFKNGSMRAGAPFWSAMTERIWLVVWELSGWRSTRDTTRNAVSTAEKRPA